MIIPYQYSWSHPRVLIGREPIAVKIQISCRQKSSVFFEGRRNVKDILLFLVGFSLKVAVCFSWDRDRWIFISTEEKEVSRVFESDEFGIVWVSGSLEVEHQIDSTEKRFCDLFTHLIVILWTYLGQIVFYRTLRSNCGSILCAWHLVKLNLAPRGLVYDWGTNELMADAATQNPILGYSLHQKTTHLIENFIKNILDDDFQYLDEILAEVKKHFGR